jgi:LuxR family maltose regulon positive regulatory protein
MAGLEERLSVPPREVEILSFLDYGMTNAEIGRRLGISLPTVKWHLGNLYLKLNVKNRASAIRFARDNGLT